jgi:hypothetical protein
MPPRVIKALIAAVKNSPLTKAAERVLGQWNIGLATDGRFEKLAVIEETVVFAGEAFKQLATSLPANAELLDVATNNETAIVLVTATQFAVGTAATPALFLQGAATLTKNFKNQVVPTDASRRAGSAAVPIRISATNGGGAAAGTVTSGTVRVRLVYRYSDPIRDAA